MGGGEPGDRRGTHRQKDCKKVMKTVFEAPGRAVLSAGVYIGRDFSLSLSPRTVSAACNYPVPCRNVF